jgi:ribosome-binding factor A
MSQRVEKLQKLAREVLSEEIARLKDPRVGFVTVRTVRMTSDLSYAKVYVTVMGEDDSRDATMAGLKSATPRLRTVLGKEMRTRHVPELTFLIDDVEEKARRIEEILHEIHQQEDGS